jgi:hypothetical protein
MSGAARTLHHGSGDVPGREDLMEGRRLIASAKYGPDTLTVLFKAFDAAWDHLASKIRHRSVGNRSRSAQTCERHTERD